MLQDTSGTSEKEHRCHQKGPEILSLREDPYTGNVENVKPETGENPEEGNVIRCQIPNRFIRMISQIKFRYLILATSDDNNVFMLESISVNETLCSVRLHHH